jgi:hypothetical protein
MLGAVSWQMASNDSSPAGRARPARSLPMALRERVALLAQPAYTVGVSGVVLDEPRRVLLL